MPGLVHDGRGSDRSLRVAPGVVKEADGGSGGRARPRQLVSHGGHARASPLGEPSGWCSTGAKVRPYSKFLAEVGN